MTALERIAQHVRDYNALTREVVSVPFFLAYFHPLYAVTWFNFAVPIARWSSEVELQSSLAELKLEFARRGRSLRIEFVAELWQELSGMLESFGMRREASQPILVCQPSELRPRRPSDIDVRLLHADCDADIAQWLRVQHESFGTPVGFGASAADEIAYARAKLHCGLWRSVVAASHGRFVGTGTALVANGTAELAAIGTLLAYRRRGIASAVTTFLVEDFYAGGGHLAWLGAGDAAARQVYEGIGFQVIGTQVSFVM